MVFPGADFGEERPGRMEEMTVPLDTRNDMRSMEAGGLTRAEIARRLRLGRNTVAKYADMEDLSPEPPLPADRPHPAIDPHVGWITPKRSHASCLPLRIASLLSAEKYLPRSLKLKSCLASLSSTTSVSYGFSILLISSITSGLL